MRRLVLAALAVGLFPAGAQAATFSVTKQPDTNDHACTASNCSLRDAVIASNAAAGPNTINLKAGHYRLTLVGANENAAATGDLDIKQSVTIKGAGASSTTIDGNKTDRVFEVTGGASLTVSEATVTRGTAVPTVPGAPADGGAVYDHGGGPVTFTNAAITANTAAAGNEAFGGAIYSSAAVTLTDTTVIGNQAGGLSNSDDGFGGAIAVFRVLTLTRVTASGNHAGGNGAPGFGGVVDAPSGYAVDINASNLSNNTAGGDGADGVGGAIDGGPVIINHTTLRSNHAGGNGGSGEGGALHLQDDATLSNSVVANNTAGGAGNAGPSASAGGTGGGIYVFDQTARLTNTAVTGNTAGGGNTNSLGEGGGVTGGVIAQDSTISGNTAGGGGAHGNGGGIYTQNVPVSLTNSTVSGNAAGGGGGGGSGGGVYGDGTTLTFADVVGNNATSAPGSSGGGLYGATPTSRGSIVAENSALGGRNCDQPLTSQGHNLENGTSCSFTAPGDLNATPLLGPLANNGGPTPTLQSLPGSPAINHGGTAGCPASDQRGVKRPQGAACDIGSYEAAPATAVTGGAAVGHSHHVSLSGSASNPDAVAGTGVFQYGKTVAYGLVSGQVSVTPGSSGKHVSVSVGGLVAGTLYHYRLVVHNPDGPSFGADKTFKTPAAPRLSKLKVKPFASGSGTALSYSDSQAGVTTFTVLHDGKKLGSFKHKGHAGANHFHFSGKIKGNKLPPGSYKLAAKARNTFGSASHAVLRGFKVL